MSRRFLIFLALITIVGALFRFTFLNTHPIALNRDEASIGYNAYSILQTGKEEHGQAWPINIESFGDWKLPGYIYTTTISVAIFGLNEWSIRLPAALAGTLLIPTVAFLAYQLWPEKKDTGTARALWAGLSIAISPWTIRLSRQTYESMLGLFFVTLASGLIIKGFRQKEHQRWAFPLAATLLGLSMLTYHAYQVFVPLYVLGLAIIFWKKIQTNFSKNAFSLLGSTLIGLLAVGLLWWGGAQSANEVKFSGLSIFDSTLYRDELFIRRLYFSDPAGIFARLYSNTFFLIANKIWENILNILSGNFLFIFGGGHGSHDVAQMGNISPIFFLFSLVGIFQAVKKLSASSKVLLLWIGVSFVAPVITTESAHSVRLLPLIVGLSLSAGWGITYTLQNISKKNFIAWVGLGVLAIFLTYQTLLNTLTYFVVSPQRDVNNWNWIMKSAVKDVTEISQNHTVLIPYLEHSYGIYFMFYNQTDPTQLAQTVEYAPIDKEGFRHIIRYGNISFAPIDWDTFINPEVEQYALVKENDIPEDKKNLSVIKEYNYPYAQQRFLLIKNQ